MDEKKKTQDAAAKIIPDLYDRIKAAAESYDKGGSELDDIIYTLLAACSAAEVSVIAAAGADQGDGKMVMTGGSKGKVAINMACLANVMGQMLQGQDPLAVELVIRVFVRDLAEYLPFAGFEVETRQADGPRKKGS